MCPCQLHTHTHTNTPTGILWRHANPWHCSELPPHCCACRRASRCHMPHIPPSCTQSTSCVTGSHFCRPLSPYKGGGSSHTHALTHTQAGDRVYMAWRRARGNAWPRRLISSHQPPPGSAAAVNTAHCTILGRPGKYL